MNHDIRHFGIGFGFETKLPPRNLLPASNRVLEKLFIPLNPATRQASIFIEFHFHCVVKRIVGLFNDQERLTFKPLTFHLWMCEQRFSDMTTLGQDNHYSINIEYSDSLDSKSHSALLQGSLSCDNEPIDIDGIKGIEGLKTEV